MEYAGLTGKDIETSREDSIKGNNKMIDNLPRAGGPIYTIKQEKGQSFHLPFMGGNKVTLTFDRLPISRKEIDKLKGWIDLFEDALTVEDTLALEKKIEEIQD